MPDFKEIAKRVKIPDRNETSLRGQVGAVLGRKSNNGRDVTNYHATPLDQLRDPSTFAPPPKRMNSGVLPPPQLPPSSSSSSSSRPISPSAGEHAQYGHAHTQQEQGLLEEAPPPRPYRVDTTGLSTAHLPPPPPRRDGADGRSPTAPPPPYSASSKPSPPSLPPRLPPRANGASPGASSSPPAPEAPGRQAGYLDQDAVDRLGRAGVSVPGLGIGGGSKPVLPPPPPSRSSSGASPPPPPRPGAGPPASGGTMSELQSRFSKLGGWRGSSSSSPAPAPAAPSQGTTWAQKQGALKTMSDFKKDPSSVSFSDARSAASTANNFRQRHGEQVAAGVKTANSMDQKYGVSGKIGGYMGNGGSGSSTETGRVGSPAQSHLDAIGNAVGLKKKPPPPPPKKKPGLDGGGGGGGGGAGAEDVPPPVPMSTRPF